MKMMITTETIADSIGFMFNGNEKAYKNNIILYLFGYVKLQNTLYI